MKLSASKFNHKISLFKKQKASNFRLGFQNVTKFDFSREGKEEEGGVRGGVEKKEEELKEQIDMKSLTNFRSICPQTAEKNAFKVIWGPTNRPTDSPMDEVSYRGACWRLKTVSTIFYF
jgi:hypothetical protein